MISSCSTSIRYEFALISHRFDEGGNAVERIAERRIGDIEIRVADVTRQAEAVG